MYPRPPIPNGADIYDNQSTYYGTLPSTSNLNVQFGENVANLVLARVGVDGKIRFWNANPGGDMNVIVDIAGWYDSSQVEPTASPNGIGFTPVTPSRLLNTRDGPPLIDVNTTPGDPLDDEPLGRQQVGDIIELQVRDLEDLDGTPGFDQGIDIPDDATSVVLNITAGGPTGSGYVTAYPSDQTLPNASNVNFLPSGGTRANLAVVKVGTNDSIKLYVGGGNPATDVHLFVDIMGYYSEDGDDITIINPTRVVDSRGGLGTPAGKFTAGQTRTVNVTGPCGDGTETAVLVNVTAADSENGGYLTIWPAGVPKPASSNMNWPAFGRDTPNMVMVGVDASGNISIFNEVTGNVNVIVDVLACVKG